MPDRSILGPRAYFFWTGTSLAIALSAAILSDGVPSSNRISYVTGCLGFATAGTAVPLAVDLIHRWILDWARGLSNFIDCEGHNPREEFLRQIAPYFAPRRMYKVGAVWATLATVIIYLSTFYGQIAYGPRFVGIAAIFVAEFQAGAGLTAFFGFARAIRRMGDHANCRVRLSRNRFGILSTGTLMFKCLCIALIIWMLYQIPIIVDLVDAWGPSALPMLKSPVVYGLTVPTLLLILGFYLWCQLPLHQQMVEAKRTSIAQLQTILDDLVPRTPESASEDAIKKIQFFEDRLLREQALPEWPSTLSTAVSTLAASLISATIPTYLSPVVKAIVKKLVDSISAG